MSNAHLTIEGGLLHCPASVHYFEIRMLTSTVPRLSPRQPPIPPGTGTCLRWALLTLISIALLPAAVAAREQVIPAGTEIEVRTLEPLGTETHAGGETFRAELARSLRVGSRAMPASTPVTGQVIELQKPTRIRKKARMGLTLTGLTFEGETYSLTTSVVEFKARRDDSIVAQAYLGAYAGAAAGTLIDQDNEKLHRWAAVAGVASALILNKRQHIELPAGQLLPFRLGIDRTFDLRVAEPPPPPPPTAPVQREVPEVDPPLLEPDEPCDSEYAITIVELTLQDAGIEVPVDGSWDPEVAGWTRDFLVSLQQHPEWGAQWLGPVDGIYSPAFSDYLRARLLEREGDAAAAQLEALLDALDCLSLLGTLDVHRSEWELAEHLPPPPPPPSSTSPSSSLKLAFLAYANGFLYDFADDLWCLRGEPSCIQDLAAEILDYRRSHSRLAWILYVLGALTSPFALSSVLLAGSKRNLFQTFLLSFLIELAEGGLAAVGELLTFGTLLQPGGFVLETLLFACATGALAVIKGHWRELIWYAAAILFALVLLAGLTQ